MYVFLNRCDKFTILNGDNLDNTDKNTLNILFVK